MVRGLSEIALLLLLLRTSCASSSIDNTLTDEDFSSLSYSFSFTFTDLDNTLYRSSSAKSNKLETKSSKRSSTTYISKSSTKSSKSKSKKVSQLSPLLKIINGRATSKTRYPYAVSLQSGAKQQRSSKHFCGGSLIASDVVLTAGHCSSLSLGTAEVSYHAVIGRPDLRYRNMGESISIKKEIRHPSYNNITYDNDFALVFLSREVQHDTAATYVKLNRDINAPEDNEGLTVMGWGDTEEDEDIVLPSNMLMETRVSAVNNSMCEM